MKTCFRTFWLLGSLAPVLLLACGTPALAEGVSDARARALSNFVKEDCGSCHGSTLKGGLGKALLPGPLERLGIEEITTIILDGVPGTPMPPWRGLLSDDEARWIAARLKEGLPP